MKPGLDLQQQFWTALARGETTRLAELVAAGADIDLPFSGPAAETPLIRAIAAGDLALVRLLLELGANVNLAAPPPRSWTPLMFAHDNPEMLGELVAAGADVHARTTAQSIRSPSGKTKTVPGAETALHLAAAAGNAEAVRVLLAAGADYEAMTENGLAPLDYAVRLGSITAAAELLVEAGSPLTPQRLELMHAAAHRADLDLISFPHLEDRGPAPSATPAAGDDAQAILNAGATTPNEWRCPACQRLIYSRKARLCGQCGALLPPELFLTDQQVDALHEKRKWARDLAESLSPNGSLPDAPHVSAGERSRAQRADEPLSPEELLRTTSCAAEFKHRDRPVFWLYVVGYSLMFFLAFFFLFKLQDMSPGVDLVMIAMYAFFCFRAWQRASPICPNCKSNIIRGRASYCHVCGKPLRGRRCATCAVDHTWLRFLRRYQVSGNYHWITFCPSCAVRLDTRIPRWETE